MTIFKKIRRAWGPGTQEREHSIGMNSSATHGIAKCPQLSIQVPDLLRGQKFGSQ
jgi:hypothetical protein